MTFRCKFARSVVLLAMVCGSIAWPASGQVVATAAKVPAYDVVSIKPNQDGSMMSIRIEPDGYSAIGVTIRGLIAFAYNLGAEDLVYGLPEWADSKRFDIKAKMDEGSAVAWKKLLADEKHESGEPMQAMLADRFKLKFRRGSKDVPKYALVIAKGGFKLRDADPNGSYPGGLKDEEGKAQKGMSYLTSDTWKAQAVVSAGVAAQLAGLVHRIVVDKTRLTGAYDFTLQWTPEERQGVTRDEGTNPQPSIFVAIEEQLGLHLQSIKGPVDTIIVDHVEMPSEN